MTLEGIALKYWKCSW